MARPLRIPASRGDFFAYVSRETAFEKNALTP